MRRLLLALCIVCSACVGDEFDAVQVTSASIDIDMVSMMAIIGGSGGDGVLTFTKDDGTTGSCNVSLRGPVLGAVFMFSGGFNSSATLGIPAASVPLSDLFGVYSGTAAGGGMIIGGEQRDIKNNNDISIKDSDFVFGIGAYVGVEFLRLVPPAVQDCVL
jgi:hypothetical protein